MHRFYANTVGVGIGELGSWNQSAQTMRDNSIQLLFCFFNSVSRPDSAMINFSCLLERLFSQSVLIVSTYEINQTYS